MIFSEFADIVQETAELVVRLQERRIREVLRTKVVPPIEGDITREILEEHGISLAAMLDGSLWLMQHGKKVAIITYPFRPSQLDVREMDYKIKL